MGFTAETRVLTTSGLRRVKDLVGKPFVVMAEGKEFASGRKGFYGTGRQPVWEVCLENGVRVEAASASVMTFDGWKDVETLRPRHDSVLLACAAGVEWEGRGTGDEGYVAGFLWANNSPNGFSVLVSNDTDADDFGPIRRIKDFYYRKRGCHKPFVITGRDMCYRRHTITSRLFREIAKEYNLPNLPQDGSHAFTIGLLQGIFDAAGIIMHNVSARTTTLRLRHKDNHELRAAQRLLMTATGITPTIRGDELIIEGDEDMRAFQQKIGFHNNEKRRLLACFRPKNIMRKNYRYAKVVSVQEKKEEAYECGQAHCFYADGVLARA